MLIFPFCVFSGCGNVKESNRNETNKENINHQTENDSLFEAETSENTSSNKLGITEASSFHGGIAIVTIQDGNTYAIDTNGNKLFEVTTNDSDIVFFGETASVENYLINTKGQTIASPEKNGYTGLLTEFIDGYAIAYYYEKAYPNSIIKIGVLNENGEWHVPLSENHTLLQALGEKNLLKFLGTYKPKLIYGLTIFTIC